MYWLATFLRYVLPYGKAFAILDSFQFIILAITFTTSMVLVTYLSGAYFTFHIEGILSEFIKVAASTFVGIAADCVIIYIFRLEQFSRILLFYFAVLSFIAILIKRISVDKLIKYYDKKYEIKSNVLMVGSGKAALTLYRTVLEKEYKNLYLFGYVADNENKKIPSYMGNKDKIRELIDGNDIEIIIIADESITRDKIKDIVVMATHHNIRV